MKLLFILTNMNKIAPNTVILDIVKYLKKDEITIISLNPSNKNNNYIKEFKNLNFKIYEYKSLKDSIKKRKLINFDNFDYIFLNGFFPNIYCNFLNNKKNISIVHSVLDKEFESLNLKNMRYYKGLLKLKIEEFLLKKQNNSIAVSSHVSQYLTKKNIKNTKITNGIDINKLSKIDYQKKEHENINICQVGRLINRKNVLFSLKFISYLRKNNIYNVNLHIFGSYNKNNMEEVLYYKEILSYISKNNLEKNVILYGETSHKDLFNKYQEMDYLIMPSLAEGMPLTLLEGMYFELIPIIDVNSPMREIISKENGIIINLNTEEKNFENIKNEILKKDKNEIKDIIKKNKKIIINNHNSKDIAKKYKELINESYK